MGQALLRGTHARRGTHVGIDTPPLATVVDAVRDGRWTDAADVADRAWNACVSEDPGALLDAVRSMPAAALLDRPTLLDRVTRLQQALRQGGGRSRAASAGASAHLLTVTSGSATASLEDLLAALTSRAVENRTSGRIAQALTDARRARALLDGADETTTLRLAASVPAWALEWARCLEFADAGGVAAYEEAFELALRAGRPELARQAAAHLAWRNAEEGHAGRTAEWTARAYEHGGAHAAFEVPLRLAGVMVHIDRLELESARAGIAELRSLDCGEYWLAQLWVRSRLARTAAETIVVENDLAAELSRRPERLATHGLNLRFLRAVRTQLAVTQGRPVPPAPAGAITTIDDVTVAVTHALSGRPALALEPARTAGGADRPPRVRAVGLLLTASAQLALLRRTAAAESFRLAHALIEAEGLHRSFCYLSPGELRELIALSGVSVPERVRAEFVDVVDDRMTRGLALLTRREREMLALLRTDRQLSDVANELFVSVNTVKTTVRSVYRKLGVHSRADAVAIADRVGVGTAR